MMMSALRDGATAIGLDPMRTRLDLSRELGAHHALNPFSDDVDRVIAGATEGRGADLAIVATAAHDVVITAQNLVRRGGRVLLFAHTMPGERVAVDAGRVCVEEKRLIGSYSASVDLQEKAARLLFTRQINVARLVTHRYPLDLLSDGIRLASHASEDSLKVIVEP
jgi:L-iditol 2-dehydrogenase